MQARRRRRGDDEEGGGTRVAAAIRRRAGAGGLGGQRVRGRLRPPRLLASHPFHGSRKSRHFLCATWPAEFEPTFPSCVTSSNNALHTYLCLYFIFFPHIILNRV